MLSYGYLGLTTKTAIGGGIGGGLGGLIGGLGGGSVALHLIEAELALSSVALPAGICAGIGLVAIGSVAAGVTYALNKNNSSIIECEVDRTLQTVL